MTEKLWQQSGHWDLYRDNMFLVESENQTFSLKPMNCPESTFIYRSKLRSYRDLPLRFSEFGRLHRNERSGTLSGLTRVRQFIQDDAHIYVRPDQLTDEIEALLGEVRESYWLVRPDAALRVRDEAGQGDRRPGAVGTRRGAHHGGPRPRPTSTTTLKPKDGTFYAPKIDIYIDDALGREWQMATIQVDLTMLPERFDLTYIDEEGKPQRPIAIHRAIYGSLERFIGILIEHFAGAFPLWLAPVQAVVIPIADRHVEAADGAGARAAWRAGCGSRSTTRRTGCSTRSGPPRSRRCRTWSCSATARSRRGRRRRGRRAGRAAAGRGWDAFADRLAEESRARAIGSGRCVPDRRLLAVDVAIKLATVVLLAWAVTSPDLAAVQWQGVHGSRTRVSDRAARPAGRLVAARRGVALPYPVAADILLGLPFLIDVAGNALNLYDTVEWWDDANHLVNWALHTAAIGLLLRAGSWGPWTRAALASAGRQARPWHGSSPSTWRSCRTRPRPRRPMPTRSVTLLWG